MLGETSPTESSGRLVASLPLTLRLSLHSPVRVTGLLAFTAAAIAFPYTLMPPKAVQLSVVARPLAASSLVVPPPVIE